jgi:hypothetical protein
MRKRLYQSHLSHLTHSQGRPIGHLPRITVAPRLGCYLRLTAALSRSGNRQRGL